MNFAQLEYPVFLFAIVLLVSAARSALQRKWIVLAASFYFYAYWDYRFLGLLLASTLLDWSIGLSLGRTLPASKRRGLLALSLFGNLGTLAFFKYYNFFIESAEAMFSRWGFHSGTLSIVLPIGISFYTFQTLSYTIDVYRRHLTPCRSLLDFSLYVTFFPQLVAGPIVRAIEFLPQLQSSPAVHRCQLYPGLTQLLRGFVKKVLIADQLAVMADAVFATPELYSGPTIAIGVLAYAGQIYGDFSGYSDIAIGSARLLGFELPKNFDHPYLATSITDFWRRWHMTLSTWLRDYLYIPLGGSRHGSIRTYINLIITMLLGGLWHGAAWNFVAWGFWHGLLLAAERATGISSRPKLTEPRPFTWRVGLRIASTFVLVLIGWTLFRTSSIDQFLALWNSLLNWHKGIAWYPPLAIAALTFLAIEHALWMSRLRPLLSLPVEHPLSPWLVGFALAAIALFARAQSQPFVYFQF